MAEPIAPIEETVALPLPPERAYAVFKDEFGAWWPGDYTYSGPGGLQAISLGAAAGDLCTEIGPHGFRVDWGRMLDVEPSRRLRFLWQIADDRTPRPDPAASSEVEVVFEPDPGGSIVRLTHSGFERYGEGGVRYRAEMAAEYGWPLIMAKFADHARAR